MDIFERRLHLKEEDVMKTLEICEGDTHAAAFGLVVLSMFRSQMHFKRQIMEEIMKNTWHPPDDGYHLLPETRGQKMKWTMVVGFAVVVAAVVCVIMCSEEKKESPKPWVMYVICTYHVYQGGVHIDTTYESNAPGYCRGNMD